VIVAAEPSPESLNPGSEFDDALPVALKLLDPVIVHHVVNTLGWPGLRPLQQSSVAPLLAGDDALLLAPTAGGKTEAAVFPLLTRAGKEGWTGTSVLYVCPLKALLNNLGPRLSTYAQWVGRTTAVWHGDTTAAERRRIVAEQPDIVLTTPESIEAILVSRTVDERRIFGNVRAVIVDEIHAFAGDDRGWHLLAVLDRVEGVAGRRLMRVGLSATVGNPEALLGWVRSPRPDPTGAAGRVIREEAPAPAASPAVEVTVDHVGSIENAALVIAALHRGEKRLAFVESRRRAEHLAAELREAGVDTYVSHSSLSAAERRAAEEAFSEARDCVIVATSTLELGIDVGDLDRVIQIGAPGTVASFLQRLGRTGRRAGSTRNCLFLCLDGNELTRALGLLVLWRRGWVEPVVPTPSPRHLAVQQILAIALQQRAIGLRTFAVDHATSPMAPWFGEVLPHVLDEGYLERDGDLGFIGPTAEKRFGHRHFSGLTASFTAPPDFVVLDGRAEVGTIPSSELTRACTGPRLLLLAGRTWEVGYVDWRRRRCFAQAVAGVGRAADWSSGSGDLSFAVVRAMRDVIRGDRPTNIRLTARAEAELSEVRADLEAVTADRATVISRGRGDLTWWTWAGTAANRTLHASLVGLVDPAQRMDDRRLRLRTDLSAREVGSLLDHARGDALRWPEVSPDAVSGLKFSEALPTALAVETLAERLADVDGATDVLVEERMFLGTDSL
jgi:ATP-dependent Lhr-like helicase